MVKLSICINTFKKPYFKLVIKYKEQKLKKMLVCITKVYLHHSQDDKKRI